MRKRIAILTSVAIDSSGNVFIASKGQHQIFKVGSAGIITTVAGDGNGRFGGDGGPATRAQLYFPTGVALDASGNLYIADSFNNRIRKVDGAGLITTVAGDGTEGYGGDGGTATSAGLASPSGMALDASGNLYIADSFNHRIRKVDSAGLITTVAGDGTEGYGGDGGTATSAHLDFPAGVALDASGNLYIADSFNHRIRKVDSAGLITTVAGDGNRGFGGDDSPATSAGLAFPTGVAVDAGGNLYIADLNNHRIRKVDSAGLITTVAGDGTEGYSGDSGRATSARLASPAGVAVDAGGNLYIADSFNHRIRKVDSAGVITTVAGDGNLGFGGDGSPATSAGLASPAGVAVDACGYLLKDDLQEVRRLLQIQG